MTLHELWYLITHPTHQDLVTSVFDAIFVGTGIQNIRVLLRDREVRGFEWKNMLLYAAWNIWTIFGIYPDAKLYLANVINVFYLLSQLIWIGLYLHFRKRPIGSGA